MVSVALVGPDGAGKSTVSSLLERHGLPAPVKRIYMGVNLESSNLMLPTTRLALAWKKSRGRRPDMTAPHHVRGRAGGGPRARVTAGVRMTLWLAEEWFRALVAQVYLRRGVIVVFDRHFYADYYHHDVLDTGLPAARRSTLHGFVLQHLYPKPDLVICLDAPAEVLYARKQEASVEWLDRRRCQYLELATVVPHFRVVDADRPLDSVAADVAELISTLYRENA